MLTIMALNRQLFAAGGADPDSEMEHAVGEAAWFTLDPNL
jgi:hypothetical protein